MAYDHVFDEHVNDPKCRRMADFGIVCWFQGSRGLCRENARRSR